MDSWPERIFVLVALVFFGYVLALLPWIGVRRRTAAGDTRSPQVG
jgi:hypothetical protein